MFALLLAGALAACSGPRFDEGGLWPPPRAGMVVCEQALATEVGVEILERGGNAADAAVAVALALAVVHPQAGNLGGGGFALWVAHDPTAEPLFLDFRECAPAALKAELFLDEQGRSVPARSLESGLAVGVPGSPRGLYEFHKKLGRLPFRELVAPAIALARDGFVVDRWLAADLAEERDKLAAHPGTKALFFAGEAPLPTGARLVQRELARTLERYAADGADGFYLGEVAQRVVAEIGHEDGVTTLADFAEYKAQWRTPLRGWFRGLEVVTAPPPSSGGIALLQMLSMLQGFPLDEELVRERADAPADPVGLSSRALHWWVEGMRLAFADRAEYLGDPDFFSVPVEALLSPARVNRLRMRIGEQANPRITPLPVAAAAAREGGQTTHLSVLDAEGNAVSLTTTLNTTFGSGILARGAGVLLNCEIDDFAIVAGVPNEYGLVGGEANALRPRKRPLSSMTPVIVRDGGQVVKYVLGSPGGPRIITTVLEVLLRTVVYGQDLASAVAAPRLHQQWRPRSTKVEPGWSELLMQGLKNRGHELELEGAWGSVQAIAVEVGGEPQGVSDPRSGGSARRAEPAKRRK
ncbi:MAG: gamma-glutamyltransferase [Planctomycetes bacterium]|nr:gamma-glutamyltransferase [Planctomycetota bacterium]